MLGVSRQGDVPAGEGVADEGHQRRRALLAGAEDRGEAERQRLERAVADAEREILLGHHLGQRVGVDRMEGGRFPVRGAAGRGIDGDRRGEQDAPHPAGLAGRDEAADDLDIGADEGRRGRRWTSARVMRRPARWIRLSAPASAARRLSGE